jgi:hypothetical protein
VRVCMEGRIPCSTGAGGVGSIPVNPDAQNVPSFRRWRFEMKLSPFCMEAWRGVCLCCARACARAVARMGSGLGRHGRIASTGPKPRAGWAGLQGGAGLSRPSRASVPPPRSPGRRRGRYARAQTGPAPGRLESCSIWMRGGRR